MRFKMCIMLASIIVTSFLLSGCFGGVEVNDRAFVQIMGIDKFSDVYSVSLQLYQPSGNGTPDTESENSVCINGEGKDLNSAISACEVRSGNKIFLGHLKSIILGNGIASPADELNTLISLRSNFGTVPLSCPVFYSYAPFEITSLISKEGLYSAEHLTDLIKSNSDFGKTFYAPVCGIFRADLHPAGYKAIPDVYINGDDAAFDGAVIKKDGLYDIKLNDSELKGYIILSDSFKKGSRLLIGTNENASAEILCSKSCITAENADGKLMINAKITLKLGIPDKITDKHKAASEVCTAVRDNCIASYSKTAWENGIDIFDIYSAVRRCCPEMLDDTDFSKLLRESVISVKVTAKSA